jgi:hypothetical protein
MTPMSFAQSNRAHDLYMDAKRALNQLSEDRLNLDTLTRAALDRARDELEQFDFLRAQQPKRDRV